ncbi:MAG: ParB/RepB/Spo0J family partition protein, partial [Chthoniobacterales bacterium]
TWHSLSAVLPTASRSRSAPRKAKQPPLPASSSMKSADGSRTNRKAASALERTLSLPPQLPLASETPATPGEQRGRRQLKGAFLIEIVRLRPDPSQPRKHVDEDSLGQLAASIQRHGVMQPVSVRYLLKEDVYQIISGERRFLAAQRAGLTVIPCVIHAPEQRQVLVRQVVENWQRAQLHPFEIADALAQLRDANQLSQKQLAEETGKPEAEISKFLKLLDLSPAVQQEARVEPTGALSFRHLYNIARLEPGEQEAMVAIVREQDLSAVDTERLVRNNIERRSAPPKRGAPVTKIELLTSKAKVTLLFRKQAPDRNDILAALEEARIKAKTIDKKTTLQIHRPK